MSLDGESIKHNGHDFILKVILDELQKVVCHLLVCSALDSDLLNLCLQNIFPNDTHPTIKADIMLNIE